MKKKEGVGANGGFDFTKKLKEMLRKKMGFGANGGFALQKKRVFLKKKMGFWPTVDLKKTKKNFLRPKWIANAIHNNNELHTNILTLTAFSN